MSNIIKTKNFTKEATEYISSHIKSVLEEQDVCIICLAGGRTPLPIYEALSETDIPWNRMYFAFGDDRNVPKDDPESNFKGADDMLFEKIGVKEDQILRIKTELGFKEAAEEYARSLKKLQEKLNRDYLFDITLLGLGHDGHTASLFPNSPALVEENTLTYANTVNHTHRERITLTYPALLSSKEIIFLSSDISKNEVVEKVLKGDDIPATRIDREGKNVTWIVGE